MTTGPRQIPLVFGHRPSLSGEDFLVTPSNRDAVRWIELWPDWRTRALVVWGPAACGKTHLAHIFAERSGGVPVDQEALRRDLAVDIAARAPACVVDDADRAVTAGLEQPLLHLHNALAERRGQLLLTAATPAARWSIRLPDLASRLNAAASVGIGAPDDALIAGLMSKLFADRRLAVDDEVILYAVPRIERSFAAARQLVADIDAAALAGRRRITLSLVRGMLRRPADEDDDDDGSTR